ncbi:Gp49 family protein [Acinetobacter baumannii]|uniref:Gp49 family protein n=1 Tax=Acinetobacter baumannii TaxID=470 RepID=UPI004027BA42
MTKEVTEQELAEKSVAPRVTKAQIDALMGRVTYTVEQRPGGTTSTFVHAFLDGKFFLATGFSACVNAENFDAENFDAEIGERMARGNAEKLAENKLWELEGYRLFAKNF